MTFHAQLAATDRGYAEGEAALAVACMDPQHARVLLEALGLGGASCRWTVIRVCAVVLDRCRMGREFSANTLRFYVPARAWHLVAPALTRLRAEGLIHPTGRAEHSVSPGAKHRRVSCYLLTLAGERASRTMAPLPGQAADGRPEQDGECPVSARGVDVSSFQGQPANWQRAAGDIQWAAVKFTEFQPDGSHYVSPAATADWAWLKAQSKSRVAYMFGHPASSPNLSAALFIAELSARGLEDEDAICLDHEVTDGLSPGRVAEWGRSVLSLLELRTAT